VRSATAFIDGSSYNRILKSATQNGDFSHTRYGATWTGEKVRFKTAWCLCFQGGTLVSNKLWDYWLLDFPKWTVTVLPNN